MNKLKIFLLLMIFASFDGFSQQIEMSSIKNTAISGGIGLGSVLAVVVSWERNRSVLFAFYTEFLAGCMYYILF
jgi:hypothetical protein